MTGRTRRAAHLSLAALAPLGVLCVALLDIQGVSSTASAELALGGAILSIGLAGLGVVVLLQQPANRIAWLLMVCGVGIGLSMGLLDLGSLLVSREVPGGEWVMVAGVAIGEIGWPVLWLLPHFFPDGRPAPGRLWTVVAWLATAVVVSGFLVTTLLPGPMLDFGERWVGENPVGMAWAGRAQELLSSSGGALAFQVVVMGGGIASLAWRWWTGEAQQRRQILALVVAMPVAIGLLFLALSMDGPEAVVAAMTLLALASLPLALGISILRYRLYELDRVVSRGVSWAVLTACLAGVYVVAVTLVTRLVPVSSTVAVSLATLACAAAFQPLRRRLQVVVDRRFNRARWDALRKVEAFGARVRGAVTPQEVVDDMVSVVSSIAEPRQASVWVRPVEGARSATGGGDATT